MRSGAIAANKYKISIQRLKNRRARIVTGNFEFMVSSASLLQPLCWLILEKRLTIHLGSCMFKCMNGMDPQYLTDKSRCASDVHDINTRNSSNNNLYVTRLRT